VKATQATAVPGTGPVEAAGGVSRKAGRLSLRIGAKEEQVRHLIEQIAEDEMVLALLHAGTPPEGTGFADEDECAAFAASSRRKLTEMLGELDVLYGQLGVLLAAEANAA
jgi:hypothetical protein